MILFSSSVYFIDYGPQLENEKAKLETRLHELKLLEPLQYEDVAYLHTQWKELKRNTEEFLSLIHI